ncbi:hypothetical protein [Formosa sp. S-31]|uniref:hypothetical protein n=1 Tax=Formosa sp. S-31 TaxID=2790949 RepID=UPI003EC0BE2E
MVTIKDFKSITKENGEVFYALILQGGVEPVKSSRTGRTYFTCRTATVPTTFDEQTCRLAVGTQFDGIIKKINCEPYSYTIESTGEIIELNHRWEYVDEELDVFQEHVVEKTDQIN